MMNGIIILLFIGETQNLNFDKKIGPTNESVGPFFIQKKQKKQLKKCIVNNWQSQMIIFI